MSNLHPRRRAPLLVSLLVTGVLAQAQEPRPQPLLRSGDTVIGLGSFTSPNVFSINDRRTWTAAISASSPSGGRVEALVRDWFLVQQEGDLVFAPEGGLLEGWLAVRVLDSGPILALARTTVDESTRTVVYHNGLALAVTEELADVPGLPPEARWTQIRNMQGSDGVVLVSGSYDLGPDTTAVGVLVRYAVDPQGNVLSRTLLAEQGQSLAVLEGDLLAKVYDTAHALGLNASGSFICQLNGQTGHQVIAIDLETPVAILGGPSPTPGLNWRNFANAPRCDLNDLGEYVFAANTDHPTLEDEAVYTLVKNGEVFVTEGTVLPGFSEEGIGGGSTAPILLSNSGDVFWYARTNLDGGDEAYLRNLVPILHEGITDVGLDRVRVISAAADAFAISDDGRFWIGEATLDHAGDALLFVDFGLVVPIPGCLGNGGVLRKGGGEARVGQTLRLELDEGQAPGVRPVLHLSTAPRLANSPCGVASPYGEVLISPAQRFARFFLPPWDGTPVAIDLAVPNDPTLIDAVFFAQGAFWDQGNQSPAQDYWLTNALRIELGAP